MGWKVSGKALTDSSCQDGWSLLRQQNVLRVEMAGAGSLVYNERSNKDGQTNPSLEYAANHQ